MKKISILGSTGAIGTQTLDVIREHGDMQVVAPVSYTHLDVDKRQGWYNPFRRYKEAGSGCNRD